MKGLIAGAAAPMVADHLVPRPLPATFIKNTFTYELVMRDGQCAIYKQRLRTGVGCLAYEVFRIEVKPEGEMFGKIIPMREVAPSNEAFGFTAWSFQTLDRAKTKLKELVDETDEKRRRKG